MRTLRSAWTAKEKNEVPKHLSNSDGAAIGCQELHKRAGRLCLHHWGSSCWSMPPASAHLAKAKPCSVGRVTCARSSYYCTAASKPAGEAHLNLVHELHGLDDADCLPLGDLVALLAEGRLPRRGRAVHRPGHWRRHLCSQRAAPSKASTGTVRAAKQPLMRTPRCKLQACM